MINYLNSLKVVESSGKKIGLFRTICSIVGGLIVAYLGMTLLIFIIPGTAGESIIVPLLFNTFAWASVALWISLSKSKYIALLRCVVPTLIFGIALIILYNI
ncbi:hypothetical protein [Aliarcobacter vitoriensis]|uniref:DUF3649 domain-containing protein n=2 Tax=Aliarcobacter TaxID=2321111 RepID=A0A366MNV7_9BACT|nr:hypothetical protein [Aliarcobacter vitoriensis]RBQ27915.1 hypothetical protein CRU91_12005 [Aliarcobacter vitoriensis]